MQQEQWEELAASESFRDYRALLRLAAESYRMWLARGGYEADSFERRALKNAQMVGRAEILEELSGWNWEDVEAVAKHVER